MNVTHDYRDTVFIVLGLTALDSLSRSTLNKEV